MNLNILVRGQSNAVHLMQAAGSAGYAALQQEVSRLLGFDGVTDTVSIIFRADAPLSGTAYGGTRLVGDWLLPAADGWSNGALETALLTHLGALPASQRDDPTATLWLHSEYDGGNAALTQEQWVSAVRHDAAQVRAALDQPAASTPYFLVSAMPYWGVDGTIQAIRAGMEQLAADPAFNGHIGARMLDIDAALDDYDDNPETIEFGGGHIDGGDAVQTAGRAAHAIAEHFAPLARPGSPVALAGGDIADRGPEVIAAWQVAEDQVVVDVRHDGAAGFLPLDSDASWGTGWSVRGQGVSTATYRVEILDGDTLRLTFVEPLPADARLYYGYGYGRLGGLAREGRGNAVYDDQDMPIWVPAEGVPVAPPGGAAGPVALTVGAGPDALVLQVVQDAWNGSAQYVVRVDGLQLGGTLTASALRGSGQADTLTVLGDWAPGPHAVEVQFLNDAYGGTPETDRNLFVVSATYNGTAVPGSGLALPVTEPQGFPFLDGDLVLR